MICKLTSLNDDAKFAYHQNAMENALSSYIESKAVPFPVQIKVGPNLSDLKEI